MKLMKFYFDIVYINMFIVTWMGFYEVFTDHFLKIHRSAVHKITIVLLYFYNAYDVNLWEKYFGRSMASPCTTKTPTQVVSCGICETSKNSGECRPHTSHFQSSTTFTALQLLLTQWWDMRLQHVVWLW